MSTVHDLTVLGTGAMGRRIAANVIATGRQVAVWNRSHIEDDDGFLTGADRMTSAADAAGASPVVIAMVTDDVASDALWFGEHAAADGLGPDSVVIESSTISPDWTDQLADRLTDLGASFLAGPVLGSTPQAEAGQLVQLIGGDAGVLFHVEELLAINASKTVHVGSPAAAAQHKLIVNGWLAGQVALAAELVIRLEGSGATRQAATTFLAGLPQTSPALVGVLERIAANDTTPKFPVGLVAKDVGYLRDAGRPRPLLDALAEAWVAAAAGHATLDLVGYVHSIPTS